MDYSNQIDTSKINIALEQYIAEFNSHWADEKYKWEAVQCFQQNWDIDSPNFAEMLEHSLAKTGNLLASRNLFPSRMIKKFANAEPEGVRNMFKKLFDESLDLTERYNSFVAESERIRKQYDEGSWQNHYQNTNTISTYLWLRCPDKYYIYKYGVYNGVSKRLNLGAHFKKDGSPEEMIKGFAFYDSILSIVEKNDGFVNLHRNKVSANQSLYQDANLHIATIDFGFWVYKYFSDSRRPNFKFSLIGAKVGETVVFTPTNVEVKIVSDDEIEHEGIRYKLSPFVAKFIPNNKRSNPTAYQGPMYFTYKGKPLTQLRDEMEGIIAKKYDESRHVESVASETVKFEHKRYWWLVANPKIWSMAELPVGDTVEYSLYNDNGKQRRIFQNLVDAKVGDLVVGYESTPRKQIVAFAEVSRASDGESIEFTKTESLIAPIDYASIKGVEDLANMQFFGNAQGSFFALTEDEYDCLYDIIRESNSKQENVDTSTYTKEDFLSEVYLPSAEYNKLVKLLDVKKNIILQGAPGVGKTFAARRLAYSIIGAEDASCIEMVQFHQSYTYEDFMMGYKPSEDGGFRLEKGKFYNFCNKAIACPEKKFFFIIDEINRGNLSKIFGELLMLIENNYRGNQHKISLAYSREDFYVPENLYIIGMMNTADRSLAMIDYALRRRFSFYDMNPAFDSDGFKTYQSLLHSETFDKFIESIKHLNEEIAKDDSLGSGFTIGHSYLCNQKTFDKQWLENVLEFDIAPMLKEYWFDDIQKYEAQVAQLRNILK
jgi:5-methylcytosine-specific restriction protein B